MPATRFLRPLHSFGASAALALFLVAGASAQAPSGEAPAPSATALPSVKHADFCPGAGGLSGHPPGPPEGVGPEGLLPPFLNGLELSDDQQDAVFGVLHGQAPDLRKALRAARKAHEQLHDLALSEKYDETAARALAEIAAKANAEALLLRAHSDRRILELLTPDQRRHALAARPVVGSGALRAQSRRDRWD